MPAAALILNSWSLEEENKLQEALNEVWFRSTKRAKKKSCLHKALNEVYLQNFLRIDITFHDESNDGN